LCCTSRLNVSSRECCRLPCHTHLHHPTPCCALNTLGPAAAAGRRDQGNAQRRRRGAGAARAAHLWAAHPEAAGRPQGRGVRGPAVASAAARVQPRHAGRARRPGSARVESACGHGRPPPSPFHVPRLAPRPGHDCREPALAAALVADLAANFPGFDDVATCGESRCVPPPGPDALLLCPPKHVSSPLSHGWLCSELCRDAAPCTCGVVPVWRRFSWRLAYNHPG
jgi:hypothetical protein